MDKSLVVTAVVLVALTACVTDLRSRRIPNWLTFGAAMAAFMFHGALGSWQELALAGSGWLVGVALFLPLFLLRGMGGGDVKLVAALGSWLGPASVLWIVVYASIAGGFIALIVALRHRYLHTAYGNLKTLLVSWALVGLKPMPDMTLETSSGPRLAYAIPIFVGLVVTIWVR